MSALLKEDVSQSIDPVNDWQLISAVKKWPDTYRGYSYAVRVVHGEIDAGIFTKLACERAINDLRKWGTKRKRGQDFFFHAPMAEKKLRIQQRFSHYKGPLAGKLFYAEDWQCFIFGQIWGWLECETLIRRFQMVYVEVPRGNGKSFKASTLALVAGFCEGEGGAEVYSAATKYDQAKIVLNAARVMAKKSPGFMMENGIRVVRDMIIQESSESIFSAVGSDHDTLDGLNIHVAIVDELHAHKDRGVFDVLETGMGKRDQPLMFCITTAGFDTMGICYEVRSDLISILQGTTFSESFFGVIYHADKKDDWRDPRTWAKANPNYEISVFPKHLQRLVEKAENKPAAINNFKTKHLDIWCSSADSWLNMDSWAECANSSLRIQKYRKLPAFIGLDLATQIDVAALIVLFPEIFAGQIRVTVFPRFYIPAARLKDPPVDEYLEWVERGFLIVQPGKKINITSIEKDVKALHASLPNFEELAYDPWQGSQLAVNCENDVGMEVVEVRATSQTFNEPMKALEGMIENTEIQHPNNPVLNWMASNIICKPSSQGNYMYHRPKDQNKKIDGIVALLMGLARILVRYEIDGYGTTDPITDPEDNLPEASRSRTKGRRRKRRNNNAAETIAE